MHFDSNLMLLQLTAVPVQVPALLLLAALPLLLLLLGLELGGDEAGDDNELELEPVSVNMAVPVSVSRK